jgi:hypothetical protein
MDYNVDNYTMPELASILKLSTPSVSNVTSQANSYIRSLVVSHDLQRAGFIDQVKNKLIQYINEGGNPFEAEDEEDEDEDNAEYSNKDEYEADEEDNNDEDDSADDDDNLNDQTNRWYKEEALKQSNAVQADKNTNRVQKVDIYDNNHMPMKREHLGVNNTINVPVAQDSLNPNLKNVTTRIINLDSQFRQAAGGVDTVATDYTLDLSDPLTNVVSLRLYSIQIPFTWYVIDEQYGNTCFWLTNSGNTFKVSVPPGNYSPQVFEDTLNAILQADYSAGGSSIVPPVKYTPTNGKLSISLGDYTDPSGNVISAISLGDEFDSTVDAYFTFFDFSGALNCGTGGCNAQNKAFNSTLGWVMGFRLPIVPVVAGTGNVAPAVLDLFGPKYFILVIDDFNQNHINNGLVTITELSKNLAVPSYYSAAMPHTCSSNAANLPPLLDIDTLGNLANLNPQEATSLGVNKTNLGNLLQDKSAVGYGSVENVLPTAPRTLTQAQIYTANEIIKNRSLNTSYRAKAPTSSDTFALIPIKRGNSAVGDMYIDFSGTLQDNKRVYFGPVDIDRMHVKLLDDRGFVVDLHGVDWCVTMISENLYQY